MKLGISFQPCRKVSTYDSDLGLNEPSSTLVSANFCICSALTHNIFNLPIAEERSLVVIPQCTKNYISAVFVVKLIPREQPNSKLLLGEV